MRIVYLLIATALLWGAPALAAFGDYESGEKVFRRGDFAAARAAWREPANAGDVRAQLGLGRLLLAHAEVEGLRWIRASAEAGHLPAEYRMGVLHRVGLYVPKDSAKSVRWLERAAGHPDEQEAAGRLEASLARRMLADDYWDGIGAPRNHKKSTALIRAAAEAGNAAAQYIYGRGLEGGYGGKPDLVEAHKYYVLSWKQGFELTFLQRTIGSARGHALAIRRKMTREQIERSRARVRAWMKAKDEGKLGWVFDYRKRWSRGERFLDADESQESFYFTRVMMNAQPNPCKRLWLRSRKVVRGTLGVGSWGEKWTVEACGKQFTVPITFRRRPDRTLTSDLKDKYKIIVTH